MAMMNMVNTSTMANPNGNATNTQDEEEDANAAYYVGYTCLYALGSLYFVPAVVAWIRMCRNLRTEDRTAVQLFSLLGLGSCLRAVAFSMIAVWMLVVVEAHGNAHTDKHLHASYVRLVLVWQVLGMLASLVLVGVFLLVLHTWASMIEQVDLTASTAARRTRLAYDLQPPPTPLRVRFVRVLLAIYGVQFAAFALVKIAPSSRFLHAVDFLATAALATGFAVCVVLLPCYGARMVELLGKVAERAERRQRNIRRIAAVATVFFLLRTLSQVLWTVCEYSQTAPAAANDFKIPVDRIMEANPIFFFTPNTETNAPPVLRWVVLVEVLEFPVEWSMLVALLCVLPARAVLPSIRGYQTIPDAKPRY